MTKWDGTWRTLLLFGVGLPFQLSVYGADESLFTETPLADEQAFRFDFVTFAVDDADAARLLSGYDGKNSNDLVGALRGMVKNDTAEIIARKKLVTSEFDKPGFDIGVDEFPRAWKETTVLRIRPQRSGENHLFVWGSFEHHFPIKDDFGDPKFHSTFLLWGSVMKPDHPFLLGALPDPRTENDDPNGRTFLSFAQVAIHPRAFENLHRDKIKDDLVAVSTVIEATIGDLAKWKENGIKDAEWFESLTKPGAKNSRVLANYMGISPHGGRIRARVERFGDGNEVSQSGHDRFECDPESVAMLIQDGHETHGSEKNARFAYGNWGFILPGKQTFTIESHIHDLGFHWESEEFEDEDEIQWGSGCDGYFPDLKPMLSGFARIENGDKERLLLFFTRAVALERKEK